MRSVFNVKHYLSFYDKLNILVEYFGSLKHTNHPVKSQKKVSTLLNLNSSTIAAFLCRWKRENNSNACFLARKPGQGRPRKVIKDTATEEALLS